GGDMKPGPAVAQKLGPMGINMGKVISDVNAETSGFKGMKVPVELDVDPATKAYTIKVFSPPAAELLKKELGIEKGSGKSGQVWAGNVAFETIVGIAKAKQSNSPAKDLKSLVKTIVGTCVSMGVLIDNKTPKEIEEDIEAGVYDEIIEKELTEPSEEKKRELEEYFSKVQATQAKLVQQESTQEETKTEEKKE
ncbi:50S ribosomal protein L11, partial [Candidatus Pacearchaeota archaeon]